MVNPSAKISRRAQLPLTFAVKYFLEHYKEAAESMSVEAAIDEYMGEKTKEFERGLISRRHERATGLEMDKLKGYFTTRIVGEISPDEIREYLDKPLGRSKAVPTLKTWNNRRGYLSTFFKYCLSKKYVAENPILEVPKFRVKKARGTADTLYRFSKGLPPNLFSNNRGVNPLATAFVATGFTPGLICQKEQSFLEAA